MSPDARCREITGPNLSRCLLSEGHQGPHVPERRDTPTWVPCSVCGELLFCSIKGCSAAHVHEACGGSR